MSITNVSSRFTLGRRLGNGRHSRETPCTRCCPVGGGEGSKIAVLALTSFKPLASSLDINLKSTYGWPDIGIFDAVVVEILFDEDA